MNDSKLSNKRCLPCEGRVEKLRSEQIKDLLSKISGWDCVDEHHLSKSLFFDDFAQALEFTNELGAIAETEGHHPEIILNWGRVEIRIWTHAIGGLSENDFILAAKFDEL
jgi:4a-hydroxytetrahydrobiopterin dehydratase